MVDNDALGPYYAGAAAHLALSSFESYGITVAEALAAGTPCVVRTGSALEGWTAHEAVVGVDDPAPTVVADAAREAVGREVREPVPSWDEVTDAYEAAYREVG
jgi:glycosyltransferase involved in cell wall biosynthesis